MAWDEDSVAAFLREYLNIRNSDLPRPTMIARIRELLGMRRKVVESVADDWINVPLYQFGAPAVEGAEVEYSEGGTIAREGGWSLKVFGIGTADTTSVQVTKSRTFVAKAGTCKLVFVPIKLLVSRIAVYDRGRLVGKGTEAQVAGLPEAGDPYLRRRGCRSLPAGTCSKGPDEYLDVVECLVAGDSSGAVHRDRRSWETDVAREVSVQLQKHVDVSALVRVRRTRRLELAFAFPSGHDYRAYLCSGITWWERPR